jgi:hypothetical protein
VPRKRDKRRLNEAFLHMLQARVRVRLRGLVPVYYVKIMVLAAQFAFPRVLGRKAFEAVYFM